MAEIRPIAACLGDTIDGSFPLVLVLGREFNGEGDISKEVGTYSFEESPRSLFWNRTYSFLSRATDDPRFKADCRKHGRSPVVFSNVLPKPIPNHIGNKNAIRAKMAESDVRSHIDALFDLDLAKRFDAVILSVGDDPVFAPARKMVEQACKGHGPLLIVLPYFATMGRSNDDLDARLTQEDRDTLRSVLAQTSGV